MTSLLHLDSSANCCGESVSRQLTASFAKTWRALHGPAGYRYRDLAADPVPPLGTAYCTLGRRLERTGPVAPDQVQTLITDAAERREWALTYPLITELLAADTVLIGAPLYNYSIPASLKAWIDRVSFPGAFIEPDTGRSALAGTRIVVVTTRGGSYGPGTAQESRDFLTPYLRAYFGRHGVPAGHISLVTAELTLAWLAPHLTHLRPAAVSSLAAARTEVTVLAAATVRAPVRTASTRAAGT